MTTKAEDQEATDAGSSGRALGYVDVIYTWYDGREELRYRRPAGTMSAQAIIEDVAALQQKDGDRCPYSIRYT